MAHRFFVSAESISGDRVRFSPEIVHQMRSVLRLRSGETVIVLDNSGQEYQVKLDNLGKNSAQGQVLTSRHTNTETDLTLTLYTSVLKGSHFEWVLQKGTELGVSTFVPIISERTIVSDPARIEKKRARWERIIREAAEQSRRGKLSQLASPLSFAASCERDLANGSAGFIPWEESCGNSLFNALTRRAPPPTEVALWIGPEGGFTAKEISLAQHCGIEPVTLGPRILRAETASLAAATIVLSSLGQMGR